MAVVTDKSGNAPHGAGPENKLSSVNRVAAAIIGTTTPSYIGERATDTTADKNYVAKRADGVMNTDTLTSADWAVDER